MSGKMFLIGSRGMEEIKHKANLPKGSRVYAFGAGMSSSIWGVIDQENNLVKMSYLSNDDYFATPFSKMESYNQPISKKFGIGFYWDDINPDFRFSDQELKEGIVKAKAFVEKCKAEDRVIEEANQKERAELPALFPHMEVNLGGDQKISKRNMVAELKKRFPETKFSVRKDGYDCYLIRWSAGPTHEEVAEVKYMFIDHKSSYCGDYSDYSPSNFNKVFGGFKFIFLTREE